MRIPFSQLLLMGIIISTCSRAEEISFKPEPRKSDYYRLIWERSPFVVETAAKPEGSPLSERFALTGVTMMEGTPIFFLLDRKKLERLMLNIGQNSSGVEVVSFSPNDDPRQAKINIRMAGEQASIGYDLAALQSVNTPVQQEVASNGQPEQNAVANHQGSPAPAARKIIRRSPINLSR